MCTAPAHCSLFLTVKACLLPPADCNIWPSLTVFLSLYLLHNWSICFWILLLFPWQWPNKWHTTYCVSYLNVVVSVCIQVFQPCLTFWFMKISMEISTWLLCPFMFLMNCSACWLLHATVFSWSCGFIASGFKCGNLFLYLA